MILGKRVGNKNDNFIKYTYTPEHNRSSFFFPVVCHVSNVLEDPEGVGSPAQLSSESLESTNVPFKKLYKNKSFKGDSSQKMLYILRHQFVAGSPLIYNTLWHYKDCYFIVILYY